MKKIKLSKGKYAIVDDEDFENLSQYSWHFKDRGKCGYASRSKRIKLNNGKITCLTIYMHRHLMENKLESNLIIDHINNNSLDNRKSNLRVCTQKENCRNTSGNIKGSSKYIGVSFIKHAKKYKWRVRIGCDGIDKHLGYFKDEIEAARVRDEASIKYFGEFARLNFPKKGTK